MSSERIIGTETEYGVYRPGDAWANPIALSTRVVSAYGEISREGTPASGSDRKSVVEGKGGAG